MYYFTTQQLQGATRYSNGVLIGNWNEDTKRTEALLHELNEKRKRGELPADIAKAKLEIELKPCVLTARDDEIVQFEDCVQIAHTSDARLCRNLPTPGVEEFHCTSATTKCLQSVTRNTFQFKKCPKEFLSLYDDEYEDEFLHYGQKMLVKTVDQELYLASESVSIHQQTANNRQQRAFFTPELTYYTVWQIRHVDPELWMETQGQKLKCKTAIALVHCATNQALKFHSEKRFQTESGIENEVSVQSMHLADRRNCLDHYNKGQIHGSEAKQLSQENHWQILTQTSREL